jgi:chromosome segregation ATPase
MNALELADKLHDDYLLSSYWLYQDSSNMLRQQFKEIEQLTITNQDLKYQLIKKAGEQVLDDFSKDKLQKQAKEIEDFRFVLRNLTLASSKKIGDLEEELKNSNINLEYLREKFTERIKEINQLRDELEDCTCQGGHSEAYLKVKGKL